MEALLFTEMASKVPVASRGYALNLYRQLLSLSRRLPSGQQRDDAVRSVREGFRTNAEVTDPSKASLDACGWRQHCNAVRWEEILRLALCWNLLTLGVRVQPTPIPR